MFLEYNYIIWYLHIILESLPISSSTHINLINKFFKKNNINENFEHLMHFPTALILSIFIFQNFLEINILKLFFYIFIADSITLIFYFLFKFINKNKFPVTLGLIITFLLLLSLLFQQNLINNYIQINIWHAGLIGFTQGLSLLPGISRLASTYVIGSWLCLSPKDALIFSLIIQLPLILAALTKSLYDLKKNKFKFLKINFTVILFLFLSTFISYLFLYLVLFLAQKKLFWLFALYLVIPIFLSMLASLSKG